MDRVCFVIKQEHDDKSAPKLIEQILQRGLHCVASETPLPGHFNVGWGNAAVRPGLNCERPHNKLWEIETLAAARVRTVPHDISFDDAVRRAWAEKRDRGQPATILGRSKNHHQGLDIAECPLLQETLEGQLAAGPPDERGFWTQVVPKVTEYRVHAFGGAVERAATKVPKTEEARRSLKWNQENCEFLYDREIPEGAKQAAIAAVRAYGLDFGAVDVLETAEGEHFVLEVNLRPGLNPEMVQYYADRIVAAAKTA